MTVSTGLHWLALSFLRILSHCSNSTSSSSVDGSAAALVHAFLSRVDYSNAVYAGAQKTVTDKLQRMLNAAARQWHTEVWSRSDDTSARWTSLAGCATAREGHFHLNTYGCRSFSIAGPTVWNLLPDELRGGGALKSQVLENASTENASTENVSSSSTISSKKERIAVNVYSHPKATGRHLPYGITQCYLPPDTSERALP